MNKLLVATLVGMCATVAPLPAAHADGPGWVGTCRIETLGGPIVWHGEVNIAVAVTVPGATISAASCTMRVNGGISRTVVTATPPPPAVPFAVGAEPVTFTAPADATVELCTHVTTSSHHANSNCAIVTLTPI